MLRPLQRLSPSFVMLDFLYGYSIYAEREGQQYGLDHTTAETIARGTRFCQEFLEPMVEEYGVCSIANGYVPTCGGPHQWSKSDGVAVDIAFHEWVNNDKPPIALLSNLDKRGVEFERLISYAGTEFACVAWKPDGGNRAAFYENVRQKGKKPMFITHGRTPADRVKRIGVPVRSRRDWRRDAGEVIYHSRSNLRAQHIRVSQYFTLLDMCRNVKAFSAGVSSVLPAQLYISNFTDVARMFGEVLDPLVAEYGQISIVRGLEPRSPLIQKSNPLHYWADAPTARIVIAVNHDKPDLEDMLWANENVNEVRKWGDDDSTYYAIVINQFEYERHWTSANAGEGL